MITFNFITFNSAMQLFITPFEKSWTQIIINNKDILDQMRKVLRMKIWDKCFVQNNNERLEIEIKDRDKTTITWKMLSTETRQLWTMNHELLILNSELCIIISMSNKRPKMELIVQKLSEIWIKYIYIRPSERSIIKEVNDKKMERLYKISQEAVEQSRWRDLPKIEFIKDISKLIQDKKVIIFDKSDKKSSSTRNLLSKTNREHWNIETLRLWNIIWIIGPEGWLTPKDYQSFWENYEIVSLWDTVLRMETASIIAWRYIKNLSIDIKS